MRNNVRLTRVACKFNLLHGVVVPLNLTTENRRPRSSNLQQVFHCPTIDQQAMFEKNLMILTTLTVRTQGGLGDVKTQDIYLLATLPTTQSHSRVIVCEQKELIAKFARVPWPKTTWIQTEELCCSILLHFPCE